MKLRAKFHLFVFRVRLEQVCEFFIDRGVLGVSKDMKRLVFEYRWVLSFF